MDFLISNYEIDKNLLENSFLTCGATREQIIFRDNAWRGIAIATASPYVGFNPFSDIHNIYLVIGDPLLHLDDHSTNRPIDASSNERTVQIASAWQEIFTDNPEALTPWHPSLMIHISKTSDTIEVITDPGSFITLYYHENSSGIILASSPDLIAALIHPEIDEISLAERLASGQITYPYTFYKGIQQMPPGAHINIKQTAIKSRQWWIPPHQSKESYGPTKLISNEIRQHGEDFLSRIATYVGRRGYLSLSAGTDTRYLADLIAKNQEMKISCICSTATENNESWSARQVAQALGLKFIHHMRPLDQHAASVLPPPLLISTQYNWEHIHFHLKGLGILSDAQFVLGGYAADTFLANGDMYNAARHKAYSAGKLDVETAAWATNTIAQKLSLDLKNEIIKRRQKKSELLDIPSTVSQQLTNIWPFSLQHTKGHFEALRRNYPAYEFFMTTPIVELGFKMSESDKTTPGKSALLRPRHDALSKVKINPDSDPEVRKAVQTFKKHYPKRLWPDSLLYPGPWSEKRGLLSQRLEETIAIARQMIAQRLSLENFLDELNGMHCYAAYIAIQIAERWK